MSDLFTKLLEKAGFSPPHEAGVEQEIPRIAILQAAVLYARWEESVKKADTSTGLTITQISQSDMLEEDKSTAIRNAHSEGNKTKQKASDAFDIALDAIADSYGLNSTQKGTAATQGNHLMQETRKGLPEENDYGATIDAIRGMIAQEIKKPSIKERLRGKAVL